MPIETGKTYVLINKKSGTALDFNTGDYRSVQGWARHGRANQQWRFSKYLNDTWIITNVQYGYLSVDGAPDNGRRIICVEGEHAVWRVSHESSSAENVYRFVPLGTQKSVDLADGKAANGTRVQVWDNVSKNENQLWEAQQVFR